MRKMNKDSYVKFLLDYQTMLRGELKTTASDLFVKHHIAKFKQTYLLVNRERIRKASIQDLVNKIMPELINSVRDRNRYLELNPAGKKMATQTTQLELELGLESVPAVSKNEPANPIKDKIDNAIEKLKKELYELYNFAS